MKYCNEINKMVSKWVSTNQINALGYSFLLTSVSANTQTHAHTHTHTNGHRMTQAHADNDSGCAHAPTQKCISAESTFVTDCLCLPQERQDTQCSW